MLKPSDRIDLYIASLMVGCSQEAILASQVASVGFHSGRRTGGTDQQQGCQEAEEETEEGRRGRSQCCMGVVHVPTFTLFIEH